MARPALARSATARTNPLATPSAIAFFQRTVGNQATGRLLGSVGRPPVAVQRNGDWLALFMGGFDPAGKTLLDMLRVQDLVNLSEVSKAVEPVAHQLLYRSHATSFTYQTKPSAAKKIAPENSSSFATRCATPSISAIAC